jgi:hypothetical protein
MRELSSWAHIEIKSPCKREAGAGFREGAVILEHRKKGGVI